MIYISYIVYNIFWWRQGTGKGDVHGATLRLRGPLMQPLPAGGHVQIRGIAHPNGVRHDGKHREALEEDSYISI